MKTCTRCKFEKGAEDFYRRRTGYLLPTCKECTKAIRKERYDRDPQAGRAVSKRYYWAHKEVVSERVKTRRRNHPEIYQAYGDTQRQRENYLERKAAAQRFRKHRLRSNGGALTERDWRQLLVLYGGCCLRCGSRESITIDHVVPVSRGGQHCAQNVQPLCARCNASKKHYHETDYRLTAFARMKFRDARSVDNGKCVAYVERALGDG